MNISINERLDADAALQTVKAKQKATWEDGDYASFAKYMEAGAVEVLDSWDITPDKTLLDVGCGAGQTSIPAAKRGIKVTGVDIAENLVAHARKRAIEARLDVGFDVGDAEDLPYSNNSYDVLISMFGAMFAPRPDKVVIEFERVLKPGGKLIMANWTPTSMPAQMFKLVSSVVKAPAGSIPPVLWGDEETVRQRLNDHFTDLRLTRRIYPSWHYPFGETELVDLFRTHFGPVKRAFESIDTNEQAFLAEELASIYRSNSRVKNNVLTITGGEFLEVTAVRR